MTPIKDNYVQEADWKYRIGKERIDLLPNGEDCNRYMPFDGPRLRHWIDLCKVNKVCESYI